MEINKILAEEFNLKLEQVDAIIGLINDGNTIPFIARYRKEVTGGVDDEILRKFNDRNNYLINFQERMDTIIASITEQGKMSDELMKDINNAKTLSELEDIYRPYKPKKKTRASVAKEKGLEPLANYILNQVETTPLIEYAKQFINEEKGVKNVQDALNGASDIIAEGISDDAKIRAYIRKITHKEGLISSKEIKKEEKGVYDMYADYHEPISRIVAHRVLALNRGENQKYLKVSIDAPEETILNYVSSKIIKKNSPFSVELRTSIEDAYKRLIKPSIENEIRAELTENAEEKSMNVFKDNLHQLLLTAPIKNKVVLGFDPGYAHGCKLAVCDEYGKVLSTNVIYPTKPREDIVRSKQVLINLIGKYHINLIALGNGTASRESEALIRSLIDELNAKDVLKYSIVNESGASVYSATELAAKEFPDFDVNLRSAVSLARRLQDPLAELVKIPPEAIGVGQYQHDMNQKRLNEVLSGVVENCVNSVGVDLNTASASLLTYVSGINSSIANNIVTYREANGAFKSRKELMKVSKLGEKAFVQCAGFMRIRDGYPLDNTAVHPESYDTVLEMLKILKLSLDDINTPIFEFALSQIDVKDMAKKLNVGEPTLKDIIDELMKPGRDIRETAQESVLRSDITEITDLKEGMILKGTVRNIMDFGCFVDIGVHVDGLVHISELSTKFVKHPLDVVHLNDIVDVKVIGVDVPKKRISLSIKQAK